MSLDKAVEAYAAIAKYARIVGGVLDKLNAQLLTDGMYVLATQALDGLVAVAEEGAVAQAKFIALSEYVTSFGADVEAIVDEKLQRAAVDAAVSAPRATFELLQQLKTFAAGWKGDKTAFEARVSAIEAELDMMKHGRRLLAMLAKKKSGEG